MNIRTFTGKTMAQALALTQRELGSRAVVLHTRTIKRGGVMGIGAKTLIEITAADGREVGRQKATERARQVQTQKLAQLGPDAVKPSPTPMPVSRGTMPVDREAPAGDLIRRTYAAAMSQTQREAQAQSQAQRKAMRSPLAQALPNTVAAVDLVSLTQHAATQHVTEMNENATHVVTNQPLVGSDQLSQEMAEVKRMLARMMISQAKAPATPVADLPDKLFDHYRELIEQELAEELAAEVMQTARGCLDEDELLDDEACAQAVGAALADLIPVDTHAGMLEPTEDGRARVIALVGPTGVGKTTTLAKLAATFKLKHKKNVGLITIDTYRIAAIDQLRTYAQIIGLPLHVVNTPQEMDRAVRLLSGCDAVLIDTAGRSPRNTDRLAELGMFLRAARPHEVHLVLSATSSARTLEQTAKRFESVKVDRLIFTKLDEAVCFGGLLSLARKVGKRVSYVTTGQEVPHQIEAGCADRLAACLLQGRLVDASETKPRRDALTQAAEPKRHALGNGVPVVAVPPVTSLQDSDRDEQPDERAVSADTPEAPLSPNLLVEDRDDVRRESSSRHSASSLIDVSLSLNSTSPEVQAPADSPGA